MEEGDEPVSEAGAAGVGSISSRRASEVESRGSREEAGMLEEGREGG